MARAQVHHRLHVDFVKGGQNGRRVLGLEQAFGDARAQAGHGHALFEPTARVGGDGSGWCAGAGGWGAGRGAGCGRGAGRGWGRSVCRSGVVEMRQDVGFGQATVAAAAADAAGVELVFLDQAAHGGAERAHGWSLGWGAGRGSRCWGGGWAGGVGAGFDHRDQVTCGDRRPVRLQNLTHHTVARCWNLQHHFIGFQIHQVFVSADRVPRAFVPVHQRRVRYRFR